MSPTQRVDIQEREHLVRLIKLKRWNLAWSNQSAEIPYKNKEWKERPLMILQKMQAAVDAIFNLVVCRML